MPEKVGFFFLRKWSKRGRQGPHNPNTWIPPFKIAFEVLGYPGFASIKQMSRTALHRARADCSHQVRAKDPLHSRMLLHFPDPHCRHAVWRYKESTVKSSTKAAAPKPFHDTMHPGHAHIALDAGGHTEVEILDRSVEIDCMNSGAQYVGAGRLSHQFGLHMLGVYVQP